MAKPTDREIDRIPPADGKEGKLSFALAVRDPARAPFAQLYCEERSPVTFAELGLSADLIATVENDLGFGDPMPIQREAIPHVLAGRDVLGMAQTGTGKTAAFGLPIMQRLATQDTAPGFRRLFRCLVITPTRELALQVHEHFERFAANSKLRGVVIVGGEEDMPSQEHRLRLGGDWLVATPGRLLSHLAGDYLDFKAIRTFVLDEADRLLELGFLPDVQRISAHLPEEGRQTLLFSATLPPAMQQLAKSLLHKPVRIDIGLVTSADGLIEEVFGIARRQKLRLLEHLLKEREITSAIVFVRTRERADQLASQLTKRGFEVDALHGDRSMEERLAALDRFRKGAVPFLIATDLAARGLDISGISHVINYDVPNVAEDYIHRVGRAGRAGRPGAAITLMTPEEEVLVARIEQTTGKRLPEKTVEGFEFRTADDAPASDDSAPHRRKVGSFNTRKAPSKKKESPFTKRGKVRPGYEIPDADKDVQKKAKRRTKLKKRLPHQK